MVVVFTVLYNIFLAGFMASIVGGAVLDAIQKNSNMIFGLQINAQQFLSAVSFILIVVYTFCNLKTKGKGSVEVKNGKFTEI